jgi:hypothetical protein
LKTDISFFFAAGIVYSISPLKVGSIFNNTFLAFSSSPLRIRNSTDSGINLTKNGRKRIGMAPSQTTGSQPTVGRRARLTSAAEIEPIEYPQNIIETRVVLKRFGENSAVYAYTIGMTPPKPIPATTRQTANISGPLANPDKRENTLNIRTV